MKNIENIDRLKKEYALLKDCFESDSKYQWVVPTSNYYEKQCRFLSRHTKGKQGGRRE